jgi:hypothetical protein
MQQQKGDPSTGSRSRRDIEEELGFAAAFAQEMGQVGWGWHLQGFSERVGRWCQIDRSAGIVPARASEAGRSGEEISSITGISPAMIRHYLRFANQKRLARAAVRRLEGRTARELPE